MSRLVIQGKKPLSGEILVRGSKNAALPLLAGALLTSGEVRIENLPAIRDVLKLVEIAQAAKANVDFADGVATISAEGLDLEELPDDLVGELRGSVLLLGVGLAREKRVSIPLPGGDIIGARPLTAHFDAFEQLGAVVTEEGDRVSIDGSRMKAGRVVMSEFSVTGTENAMLAAATLPGMTTIEIAAAEPHVAALGELLTAMGATVTGGGTHTLTIKGNENLGGARVTNIPDMLEAGLWILLGAATKSELKVRQVPVHQLDLFFKKLDDIGITYELASDEAVSDVVVKPSELKAFRMQSLPYPGIPTDLQAPFSVIATQADGESLIHDPLYEDRFRHIEQMEKMGAQVRIADQHRVFVTGPTTLRGATIPSLDIRSGATLIMAGLIAEGETVLEEAEIIDRGYEDIEGRLQALGAEIRREE